MDYLWLKAFHIIAVMTWIGGMLAVAIATTAAFEISQNDHQNDRTVFFTRVRRWDQRVTTPAMLLVWALGFTLAVTGQWLSDPWLMVKIGLVLVLSGLHGMLSGGLRRLSLGQAPKGPTMMRFSAIGIILIVFTIVVLVVIKPF